MRSIDFSAYVQPNQGSLDYTPYLVTALADAALQKAQEIYFPEGGWNFYTPIPSINGIRLQGKNASATQFYIKHAWNGLYFGGGNGKMCGGASDISIWAAPQGGGISNVGLYLEASPTMSPDFAHFENVIVTALAGCSWNYGLHINGTARTSPQGVRDIHFRHVEFFAANYYAMYLRSAVGIKFDDVGCYPAGGTSGNVLIDDSSCQIHLNGASINGSVTVSGNSTNVWHNGTKIA